MQHGNAPADSIVLTRAEYIILYIDLLRRIGTPVERELRRAKLPTLIEEIPDALVSMDLAFRFLSRCARSEGIDDSWSWQAGIAYDTSPVDADDRTADLPIDRQVRYAFGVTHTPPEGPEISGSFVYADYGDAEIDALGYDGDYSSNDILFLSVSVDWRV